MCDAGEDREQEVPDSSALGQSSRGFTRIAVVMRDIEGLSYEEIAESMQISLGTVKSRIARGRETLKHVLKGATS